MVFVHATGHVLPGDASKLMERFWELSRRASTDVIANRCCELVLFLAERLGAADAASWMEQCLSYRKSSETRSLAERLIPVLAARLSETDASILVQDCLDRLERCEPGQLVWRKTIPRAITRVGEESAAALCSRLLSMGMTERAVAIAESVDGVVLVRRNNAGGRFVPEDVQVWDRNDPELVFDANGSSAPLLIRMVLEEQRPNVAAETLHEERDSASAGGQRTQREPASVRLTWDERRVLSHIAMCEERNDDPPTQQEIGNKLDIGADAAWRACNKLKKKAEFIGTPYGDRSGYRLTDAGRAFLRDCKKAAE